MLWTIHVDRPAKALASVCERALVKSRAKLNYAGVQKDSTPATRRSPCSCCARSAAAEQREPTAVASTCPSRTRRSHLQPRLGSLGFRALLPVEGWNAQISLLTGMAAAELMMKGRIGVLRTLPEVAPTT